MLWREKMLLWLVGRPLLETTKKMNETRIVVRLLRMNFPRNWEFGSALSKLRNFGGEGVSSPKTPPLGAPLLCSVISAVPVPSKNCLEMLDDFRYSGVL